MQFVVNYKPISVFRMSKSNNVTRAVGSKVDRNFLYKCSVRHGVFFIYAVCQFSLLN